MVVCEEELQPLASDADITDSWLVDLLSRGWGCGVNLLTWDVTRPKDREGFLSEIAYVKVSCIKDGGEKVDESLVFKFLPFDSRCKEFIDNAGLVEREIGFYKFIESADVRKICETGGIQVPVPKVWYAGVSKRAMTLVLQDLSVAGYAVKVVRDGSTLHHTITVARAAAVVHALGMAYLHTHPATHPATHPSLAPLAKRFDTTVYEEFFQPNMDTLIEKFRDSELGDVFSAIKPHTKAIPRPSSLNTIIHGDLWAGQVLFSKDDSSAVMIDWQFCQIGNPVNDLMSMLFMSSHPDVIKQHKVVIEEYWDALSSTLAATNTQLDVTQARLLTDLEEHWIMGFLFLTVSLHDFLGADNISEERLKGAYDFLHQRKVFAKFLEVVK